MPEITFREAPEVRHIAKQLIENHHPELKNARMLYLFREGSWPAKGGQATWAKAKKCSALEEHLGHADFIIIVNEDIWNKDIPRLYTSVARRQQIYTALIGHELSHCGKSVEGNWTLFDHEFVGFKKELNVYGAWSEALQGLQETLLTGGQISYVVPYTAPEEDKALELTLRRVK